MTGTLSSIRLSALIAAKECGRLYKGIELEEEYVRIALGRLGR